MISPTDIGASGPAEAPKGIGDLRRRQPAEGTLKNLLGVLNAKLELCARLPVYEWEAGREGFDDCAAAFRDLAEAERQSCADTIDLLRTHLEQLTSTPGGRS